MHAVSTTVPLSFRGAFADGFVLGILNGIPGGEAPISMIKDRIYREWKPHPDHAVELEQVIERLASAKRINVLQPTVRRNEITLKLPRRV